MKEENVREATKYTLFQNTVVALPPFFIPHPSLKFRLNKSLDKKKIIVFLSRKPMAGIDFKKLIFDTHPKLKFDIRKNPKKLKNIVSAYVDDMYNKNRFSLKITLKKMEKEWKEIEPNFLRLSNQIFKNINWPKGRYICYLTISPPFPRFLDTMTFQVGFTKDGKWKASIAHEMLHFIFYEYIRQKFTPSLANTIEGKMNQKTKGVFKIPLWDVSEIFNVIILNDVGFQKILNNKQYPYPKHKKSFVQLRKTWNKSGKDIDTFLHNLEANK